MSKIKIILVAMVLVLLFLLIRQNLDVLNQQVQFKLNLGIRTFQSVHHSLWVILAFTFFIGALGTGLYSLTAVFKQRRANRLLQHDLKMLKSELQTIKPQMATPVDTGTETAAASANPEAAR
jgi:Trk-type K+ transport system membrane component